MVYGAAVDPLVQLVTDLNYNDLQPARYSEENRLEHYITQIEAASTLSQRNLKT